MSAQEVETFVLVCLVVAKPLGNKSWKAFSFPLDGQQICKENALVVWCAHEEPLNPLLMFFVFLFFIIIIIIVAIITIEIQC